MCYEINYLSHNVITYSTIYIVVEKEFIIVKQVSIHGRNLCFTTIETEHEFAQSFETYNVALCTDVEIEFITVRVRAFIKNVLGRKLIYKRRSNEFMRFCKNIVNMLFLEYWPGEQSMMPDLRRGLRCTSEIGRYIRYTSQ